MSIKAELRLAVFARDEYACRYCDRDIYSHEISLHADHHLAKVRGGPDTINNLVTACSDCNLRKSAGLGPPLLPTRGERKKEKEGREAERFSTALGEINAKLDNVIPKGNVVPFQPAKPIDWDAPANEDLRWRCRCPSQSDLHYWKGPRIVGCSVCDEERPTNRDDERVVSLLDVGWSRFDGILYPPPLRVDPPVEQDWDPFEASRMDTA